MREKNVIKIVFLVLAQVQDISGESQLEEKKLLNVKVRVASQFRDQFLRFFSDGVKIYPFTQFYCPRKLCWSARTRGCQQGFIDVFYPNIVKSMN